MLTIPFGKMDLKLESWQKLVNQQQSSWKVTKEKVSNKFVAENPLHWKHQENNKFY